MIALSSLTPAQLIKAAKLKEQIAKLEKQLASLLQVKVTVAPQAAPKVAGKRKMSAAGRARIVAAQKARWAKLKAKKGSK